MEDLNIPTNNDGSNPFEFYFTTPKKDGDLYISILSYPSDLIPIECASSSVDVYQFDTLLSMQAISAFNISTHQFHEIQLEVAEEDLK